MSKDPRHLHSRALISSPSLGKDQLFSSPSIMCEVFAALTWSGGVPPVSPEYAAMAISILTDKHLTILPEDGNSLVPALNIASSLNLTARRIHDARHAGCALHHGILDICTYDVNDWMRFAPEGFRVRTPEDILKSLQE